MVARARRSEWEKFFPSVFPNIGYFESNEYSSVTEEYIIIIFILREWYFFYFTIV